MTKGGNLNKKKIISKESESERESERERKKNKLIIKNDRANTYLSGSGNGMVWHSTLDRRSGLTHEV